MNNRKVSLLFCLFVFATITSYTQTAFATDQAFRDQNDINFVDDSTCGEGQDVIPASDTSPSSGADAEARLKDTLVYLTERGLTLAAAAGAAGNIKVESASTYSGDIIQGGARAPAAKKDSSGNIIISSIFKPVNEQGFGISQWTLGGTTSPRQGLLYKLAVKSRVDIIDNTLQRDFLWFELTGSYKTSTYDRIKNMSDPREAAKIYMVNFEGPLDQSPAAQNGRADDAEEIYNKYKASIPDGTGSTINVTPASSTDGSTCQVVDTATGGVGSIDGFTFPLKTTQAELKKGTDGSVWCFDSPTKCHHHYNAADIFAETGTPIIAAAPGNVVSKTTDSCDYYGCNVTIMGDDGHLYYYTHMSKQGTVNVGQKIQAGQEIGSVGTNATAMDTPRHLHFDMLPGDKYKFRPSCSSAECMVYPFINVQQYLVPAFKTLPEGVASV